MREMVSSEADRLRFAKKQLELQREIAECARDGDDLVRSCFDTQNAVANADPHASLSFVSLKQQLTRQQAIEHQMSICDGSLERIEKKRVDLQRAEAQRVKGSSVHAPDGRLPISPNTKPFFEQDPAQMAKAVESLQKRISALKPTVHTHKHLLDSMFGYQQFLTTVNDQKHWIIQYQKSFQSI